MNTAQKLALAVAALSFMGGASTQLTDIFAPFGSSAPAIVKEIVSLSTFVAGFLSTFLAFITGQGAQLKSVVEMAKDPHSAVQGIITTATPEGKALAASIVGPIVPAGSPKADELSKP